MQLIQIAYLANIVILAPIAVPTIFRIFPVEQKRFPESPGCRILVGALWAGIFILSILGIFSPLIYSPVLLLQLIYKSIWLLAYALPRFLRGDSASIPWGIAASFIVIVICWPFLIPWTYLFAGTH